MGSKNEILGQNFAQLDRLEGSFLTILGVKKVVFLTFSELFRSSLRKCLGIVFWP